MSHESIHCGLAEHTCPDVNVVDLPVSWLSSSSCGGCRGCWWQLGCCGNAAAASAAGVDPPWQQEFSCPFGHCWGVPPPLNCCPATAWNLVKMLNENCSQWNKDFKWENHFLSSETLKIWPNLSVAPKTHPMSFTSLKNDFFLVFPYFVWLNFHSGDRLGPALSCQSFSSFPYCSSSHEAMYLKTTTKSAMVTLSKEDRCDTGWPAAWQLPASLWQPVPAD